MVSYIDACYDNLDKKFNIRSGIAIAAPQIGLLEQIVYIHFDYDNQEYRYLLGNPKIISESLTKAYLKDGEGCLSVIKDHNGYVKRANHIIVEAIDLLNNNQKTIIEASGILSICLQHEIDHLHGILYYDHIDHNNPYFASDE